jgi:PAS domain S-box-containing protein
VDTPLASAPDEAARLIVDSIPGLVALLSASGEVERVNPQISEYTGKTLEALKQWGTNDTVHPEDLPHVIEIFSRSIASGQSYEIAQRLRRADGAYRWFQNNGHPIRDASGKVVRWCVLLTDINERKRAEDALRERERESRLIVDTIPGLVATLTPTGELEFVNNQVLSYCGRTLGEVKQWATSDLVHPDDLAHANQVISQSIASGQPYELEERIRRFDGVYRWFQIRGLPLRDSDGGIVRWYVLLTDIDERRRAEEEVRARERFRAIVDELPVMVTLMTPAGEFADGNRHMPDYFDASLDELKRRPTTFSFHPDDRPAVDARWRESVETGRPYDHEARLRRGDGTYRWFHTRGFPLRDAEGHIVLWHLLQTDVDDRKRAEEAVRASEREFKRIIDTIPALAWSARVDGTAEFLSQHYLNFIGLSADAAAGWGWTTAVHPDDVEGLSDTWQRILSSEMPGEAEARLRRHDGEYRWFLFRTNPLRDAGGRIIKWYGVNTDIEDRKRAEVELRRAYDSFADAQRLSHTGNFTADIMADEHVWSEELYRIFEFEPDIKIRVQAVRDVIHPDDLPLFDAGFARSLHGADFDLVFRIVTKSGKVKHVRSLARVLERVAGRPVFIGAIQDVTETRTAEEALNKARSELAHVARVTTLSTLTASIAHEVSQPLSGIITNAGTCLRMLDADPVNVQGARETARRTIRDGQRASEVITRLRALFSRKEFTLESLNLNEAIQEVIALSRNDLQRQRVALHADLADDLPNVTGDRVQLQQVILNLLRNASDAMVDIRDRQRQLLISTQRDGDDRVRVGVRDNGVGIDPQNVNKLFDAFYTTKTDGMGIGLSVSRSIVERHHGRLWVEPNDGPGAHFLLSMPCRPASEP